ALAHETAIKKSEMPAAALAAVAHKYPNAKQVGFTREEEQNQIIFEIEILDGKRHMDIDLSPQGKILAEELWIGEEALPAAVRQAVADNFRKWSVKRVERIVTEENEATPHFELLVTQGKQKLEIVFDETGRLIKQEKQN